MMKKWFKVYDVNSNELVAFGMYSDLQDYTTSKYYFIAL